MDVIVVTVIGILGLALIGRYVYLSIVQGKSNCCGCGNCSSSCSPGGGQDCSIQSPADKQGQPPVVSGQPLAK